jgi:selenocysteine-specific elongation factor
VHGQMSLRIEKTLKQTKFAGAPIVPVAANPGGGDAPSSDPVGIDALISVSGDGCASPL